MLIQSYFESTCRETEFSEKNTDSGSDCSKYVSRTLAQIAKYDHLKVNIVCAGENREGKAQDRRRYFERHSLLRDTRKLYFRSITSVRKHVGHFHTNRKAARLQTQCTSEAQATAG